MPPIKKIAKLASGREIEVRRWLPLVSIINKKRKNKAVYFFISIDVCLVDIFKLHSYLNNTRTLTKSHSVNWQIHCDQAFYI